jgi:hypothetical protein
MASIATYTVTGWRGRLYPAVRRIARLPARGGKNGTPRVYDGWETNPEPIVTSAEFATLVLAQAARENYRKTMDGLTKTAVDPHGESWSVKVTGMRPEISLTVTGAYKLIATWTLEVEAEAPV